MAKKITFLGGSTSNLRTEFQERLKYKTLIDFPGMIDTLYDKFSYGLVNKKFEPVYLVSDEAVLSGFPAIADNVQCLSFVADAFQNFRNDYISRIDNTDRNFPPFLEGVTPYLGYESFEESYGDYIVYNSLKYSTFLQNDKKIDDFNCYLESLKEAMTNSLARFPITRSGFLLSRHNSIRTSGLVIELAKLDYDRDFEKGQIVQSKDFQCFVDYAMNSGFYIDKYNPWRLFANLEHPTMKQLMRRGSTSLAEESDIDVDPENVMNSIYRLRSHDDDLYDLQDFVIKTYNDLKKGVPFYTRTVYNNGDTKRKTENVFRPEIEMLSAEEWLELLLMVRFTELGAYDESEFQKQLKMVIYDYRSYGTKHAVSRIGLVCAEKIKEIYEKRRENNTTPRY